MNDDDPVMWLDLDYDQDKASDLQSRYGAYLRHGTRMFEDDDTGGIVTDPVRFAAVAFRIASPPIMAPGLVRCHDRILSARAERDDWDGQSLLVAVDLVSAWPAAAERDLLAAGWDRWRQDMAFGGWHSPQNEGDSGPRPVALATLQLVFPVPAGRLPAGAADPRWTHLPRSAQPDLDTAIRSVRAVAAAVNEHVGPIVAALDAGAGR
jgi:hypothetical protein